MVRQPYHDSTGLRPGFATKTSAGKNGSGGLQDTAAA